MTYLDFIKYCEIPGYELKDKTLTSLDRSITTQAKRRIYYRLNANNFKRKLYQYYSFFDDGDDYRILIRTGFAALEKAEFYYKDGTVEEKNDKTSSWYSTKTGVEKIKIYYSSVAYVKNCCFKILLGKGRSEYGDNRSIDLATAIELPNTVEIINDKLVYSFNYNDIISNLDKVVMDDYDQPLICAFAIRVPYLDIEKSEYEEVINYINNTSFSDLNIKTDKPSVTPTGSFKMGERVINVKEDSGGFSCYYVNGLDFTARFKRAIANEVSYTSLAGRKKEKKKPDTDMFGTSPYKKGERNGEEFEEIITKNPDNENEWYIDIITPYTYEEELETIKNIQSPEGFYYE